MLVRELIKAKKAEPLTVTSEATIAEAAQLLDSEGVGALVVVDGGQMAGILSERDIARAVGRQGGKVPELKVGDLMTREVRVAAPQDSVEDLMREMTQHRIRHLPVMDHSKLQGVISIGDVVRNRLDELESERSELHDYIAGGR